MEKKLRASPLDRKPRTMINRYSLARIIELDAPVLINARYWQEQISILPNPPQPIDDSHWGKVLWWDGDHDIVLIQLPSYAGTGHTGIYDGMDDEPFFDACRGTIDDGCVFVPSSAIDWERTGFQAGIVSQYRADRVWPTAALICNLAQYRIPRRLMGDILGVTRQAVHLAISKLPATISELSQLYGKPEMLTGECQHDGCKKAARTPRAKYCAQHWEDANIPQIQAHNESGLNRGQKGRKPKRYARPIIEAQGGVDDFLPLRLVDQSGS